MYYVDLSIIFLLILANGILAMTEFAIVSSNRNKIMHMAKKSKGAKVAHHLIDNPGHFLSTIQIGITIIGIISGAFSGQRFAEPLGIWFNKFQWIYGYGEPIAFTVIILILTYISLIIGELVPKRLALSNPEKIASLFSPMINVFSKITHPFVIILDFSTKILLRLLCQKEIKESHVTEEEIHQLLEQGLEGGTIDPFEHRLFQRVLKFGDRDASIMMTPRLKVIGLNLKDDLETNKAKILLHSHRYYPVFEENMDDIKGIIDTKDILTQQIKGEPFDLYSLIKEVPCVTEEAIGSEILEQFKKSKSHIGIVINEYGAMQGIITLVDLFETLTGEVAGLGDNIPFNVIQYKDGSWLCDGLTPIDEIEDLLKVNIIRAFPDIDFNTLAGFLLMQFGKIPNVEESIRWNGFEFKIFEVNGKRIGKVLIREVRA